MNYLSKYSALESTGVMPKKIQTFDSHKIRSCWQTKKKSITWEHFSDLIVFIEKMAGSNDRVTQSYSFELYIIHQITWFNYFLLIILDYFAAKNTDWNNKIFITKIFLFYGFQGDLLNFWHFYEIYTDIID